MKSLKIISSQTLGLCGLLLIVPPLCWGQNAPAAAPLNPSKPTLNQLMLDLHQAQSLMPSVADAGTRERLNALLTDAQVQAAGSQPMPLPAAGAVKPAPVSAHQFNQLCKGLNAETFDEGKVFYIQQISKTRFFTSAQAHRLLAAFTFDEGREDAAAALYPHVVDQDNFPGILDVFTFDDGRDKTCKRLNL